MIACPGAKDQLVLLQVSNLKIGYRHCTPTKFNWFMTVSDLSSNSHLSPQLFLQLLHILLLTRARVLSQWVRKKSGFPACTAPLPAQIRHFPRPGHTEIRTCDLQQNEFDDYHLVHTLIATPHHPR